MADGLARLARTPTVLAACAVLAVELLARMISGGSYPGATLLLLAASGLALLTFAPRELAPPTLRCAVLPALAISSLSILLTSLSTAGVALTEWSIRLAVYALVGGVILAVVLVDTREHGSERTWTARRELLGGLALLGIVAFALASAWDIAYPLQVRGSDVGHYLLYADEVADQGRLLAEDPLAGEDRLFADPPGVGALYGSLLLLDGISSWALGAGLVVLSAVSVLAVFVAAGALWGLGPGLVAAAAYAVAPIRLDPLYWHGLGTTLALVFVPLVVLGLGLLYRGRRDWRTVVLLALALDGVAAAHSTSAIVVAALVVGAVVLDLVRHALARAGRGVLRSWWTRGIVRPVLAAVAVAAVAGAGIIVHLGRQAADLGRPVDYRFLGPDWLDRAAVAGYFSWRFLAVAALAALLVLSSARLRRDVALLSILALVLACVVVNESWRLAIPFEYRRVVYYLGVALALVIGAAFRRFPPRPAWVAGWALVLVSVAQLSVGLRLPERLVAGDEVAPAVVATLREVRDDLDSGALPEARLVVTDACLHFAVPYLVRRPTLPAFGERQVGFAGRLPLARQATAVLEGGAEGRTLATRLGVDYVIVDPACAPDLQSRLGGELVTANDEVVVLRLGGSRHGPSQ